MQGRTPGLVVLLAIAGLSACAGSGETQFGAEPAGEGIQVEVRNDMIPPTSVIVWMISETGNRRRLGPVPPNGRRSFDFSPTDVSTRFYLFAEPEGPSSGTMGQVREMRSSEFTLLDVKTVGWSVTNPRVRVGG